MTVTIYLEERIIDILNCYGSLNNHDNDREGCTEKFPTSILRFPKPHPSVTVHPTQKPVELCEWLIRTFSNEGDVILDNAMGSGSTGVACVNTGRRFIGIEINEIFFQTASERIKESTRK